MRKNFPLSALLSGLIATPLLAAAPTPGEAPTITSAPFADSPSEVLAAQLPAHYHDQVQLLMNGQPLNTYGMQALNRRIAEDLQARLSQLLENGALPQTFNIQYNNAPRIQQRTQKAAFLGITASSVTGAIAAQLPLSRGMGLVVEFVQPESPADAAGLKMHDVLEKLDDQLLINPQQLAVLVRSKHPGDSISITLLRGGKESTLSAKLIEKELPVLESLQEPGVLITPNFGQAAPFQFVAPGAGNRVVDVQPRAAKFSVRVDSAGTETRSLTDEKYDITITKSKDAPEHIVVKDLTGTSIYEGDGTDAKLPADAQARIADLRQRGKVVFNENAANPAAGANAPAANNPRSVTLSRGDAEHQITIHADDSGRTLTVKDLKTGQLLFNGPFKTDDDLKTLPAPVLEKVKALNAKAVFTPDKVGGTIENQGL